MQEVVLLLYGEWDRADREEVGEGIVLLHPKLAERGGGIIQKCGIGVGVSAEGEGEACGKSLCRMPIGNGTDFDHCAILSAL